MVLGITSDVGERSSVWSDGICARKGKLVIQDCWLRNNKKITNLSKTFQLTSSSCTVSSVNGANANGMKFSGISTASVNIFQLRTVQQALKAAWRSTTLVKKAIFTINVSKSKEVIKFPVSSSWIKEWCFYFEHIIEFGMHISGLIEPGQAQATWLFSLYAFQPRPCDATPINVRVDIQNETTRFSGEKVATNLSLVIDLSFKSLYGLYWVLIVHGGLILKQKDRGV